MSKIANSRLTAFLAGVWAFYCYTLGQMDGTIAILLVYLITVWIYGTKKDVSARQH